MANYQEILAARLSEKRYLHSLGVAGTAARLASKNKVDPEQARLAGLLHDYARDLPPGELLTLAAGAGLITCELERRLPILLHGPVGALLIKQDLGIKDRAVLQAVARHTVGAVAMTALDKIIYLADIIEPERRFPGVEELRRLAAADLNAALLKAFETSILYLVGKGQPLHPVTIEARNYLLLSGQEETSV
ncbi:bis(5'-nucleosyl)-tetraphosphatase (symmetrical) YqeK [Neomoorella thermoacetica]|uniref:bis(5'-nucleosyl)-tetraphosphatase (symmetrical) n=2 Tax=Neomoorella thermoacetica TaxID=1525 RepID=A0A0S6UDF7_NEOTH|nr:bis(5'-nucleosyl)-tetraphosphatase (symmetrical) YqeK [Moorella thermoacetica]OIQ61054.1 putative nicotinate-nucleotide adenylyltransferase [Moorella thermoacetica]GAF26292.1 predicted HD superfamily hydrolase [Moorella thermoacetica Y72]